MEEKSFPKKKKKKKKERINPQISQCQPAAIQSNPLILTKGSPVHTKMAKSHV
jgi:hypothetical protein